jgi:hypothetical protein
MKSLISMTRILAIAAAMFSFASGAWAEDLGDGIAQGDEVVTNTDVTDVTGGEDLLDTQVIGDEEVADDSDAAGGDEEVADDSDATGGDEVYLEPGEEAQSEPGGDEVIYYTMDGESGDDGAAPPTEYTDAEGNVIYFRGSEGVSDETEYTPLMATSGMAGGAVTLADTAADQAGVDSSADMSLDVVGSTQADFASPIDVANVATDGSTHAGHGGAATRISGGHLDSHQ